MIVLVQVLPSGLSMLVIVIQLSRKDTLHMPRYTILYLGTEN